MSSDISEKKQAEEKLRSASQYARSLIEASLDPPLAHTERDSPGYRRMKRRATISGPPIQVQILYHGLI
jgi:hypothetical protein